MPDSAGGLGKYKRAHASTHRQRGPSLSSTSSPQAHVPFGRGRTSFYALGEDPRFSYCLYVPERATTGETFDLVVVQHGTDRDVVEARDRFANAAELYGWIILGFQALSAENFRSER